MNLRPLSQFHCQIFSQPHICPRKQKKGYAMIKKIVFTLMAVTFVASCATHPEVGEDNKQNRPENIDSEITFEGASSADEDPFFSEPIESVSPQTAEEVNLPEPTPEPADSMEPTFADQSAPEEEYEEPESEPVDASSQPVTYKKPASVHVSDAMRTPGSDCSLRSSPGTDGKRLGVAKKGRKIWTENHDTGWFKVYRKKGHAFVSKSCF